MIAKLTLWNIRATTNIETAMHCIAVFYNLSIILLSPVETKNDKGCIYEKAIAGY